MLFFHLTARYKKSIFYLAIFFLMVLSFLIVIKKFINYIAGYSRIH